MQLVVYQWTSTAMHRHISRNFLAKWWTINSFYDKEIVVKFWQQDKMSEWQLRLDPTCHLINKTYHLSSNTPSLTTRLSRSDISVTSIPAIAIQHLRQMMSVPQKTSIYSSLYTSVSLMNVCLTTWDKIELLPTPFLQTRQRDLHLSYILYCLCALSIRKSAKIQLRALGSVVESMASSQCSCCIAFWKDFTHIKTQTQLRKQVSQT